MWDLVGSGKSRDNCFPGMIHIHNTIQYECGEIPKLFHKKLVSPTKHCYESKKCYLICVHLEEYRSARESS